MSPSVSEVFDLDRFVEDVRSYLDRHNVSLHELSRASSVDLTTIMRHFGQGLKARYTQKDPSPLLWTIVSVARICDLSLDSYVRPL